MQISYHNLNETSRYSQPGFNSINPSKDEFLFRKYFSLIKKIQINFSEV